MKCVICGCEMIYDPEYNAYICTNEHCKNHKQPISAECEYSIFDNQDYGTA